MCFPYLTRQSSASSQHTNYKLTYQTTSISFKQTNSRITCNKQKEEKRTGNLKAESQLPQVCVTSRNPEKWLMNTLLLPFKYLLGSNIYGQNEYAKYELTRLQLSGKPEAISRMFLKILQMLHKNEFHKYIFSPA